MYLIVSSWVSSYVSARRICISLQEVPTTLLNDFGEGQNGVKPDTSR